MKVVLSGDHGFKKADVIGDHIRVFFKKKWFKFYNCTSILI